MTRCGLLASVFNQLSLRSRRSKGTTPAHAAARVRLPAQTRGLGPNRASSPSLLSVAHIASGYGDVGVAPPDPAQQS